MTSSVVMYRALRLGESNLLLLEVNTLHGGRAVGSYARVGL
jgi:hypothetical protein